MRCSMTCVTPSSSVFADAPGYLAVMLIVGGAMAGYCATGSVAIASAPASMMTIAMTQAKTGRSMKKRDMRRLLPAAADAAATRAMPPGRTFCTPSTITRSPAVRPDVTSHRSPMAREASMVRCSTLPSTPSTSAVASPLGLREMACWGTSSASCLTPSLSTARTYILGSSSWRGFGNTARSVTAPVLSSTDTSENCSRPVCA